MWRLEVVWAKKRQSGKQQLGMFGSGKGVWKERGVKRSEDGKKWPDEIQVGADEKTVYWGSAGVAGTSRVF